MNTSNPTPLQRFVCQVKYWDHVRKSFEVMGESKGRVQEQHADLADPAKGEQVVVLTPEEAAARLVELHRDDRAVREQRTPQGFVGQTW